ncbi:cytochrome P450 [Streptomyces sp. NPDC050636]|uniref:cytochrome P450 n=1 Tax=Streptomyces sp. NPDC050636 TaxID=3154510 RepID=UPI00342E32B3
MTEALPFPQDRACPYRLSTGYRPLSEQRPLSRVELYDGRMVWLVTGHAEARELLTDPRLSADRQNPAFPAPGPRFEALRHIRTPLLGVDGPEHVSQRRMLVPSFSAKRIDALRPQIQLFVDDLLDGIQEAGPPADLVSAFAAPLPSKVACSLLGVPYSDRGFFESRLRALFTAGPEQALTARSQLMEYFSDLIAHKEFRRGKGLLDDLVEDRLAAGSLNRFELARIAMILLTAGHETTSNMISLGTFALLEHPDQLAVLRDDGSVLPAAIEELLRLLTVFDIIMRVATSDIEVGGQTIREGEGVIVSLSLANRDTAAYPAPDTLDWNQSTRHHLAFGFGPHQCLGQNLARAEMEIAFRTLFTRFPGLRLAVPAAEVAFQPGTVLQRMSELPVAW